jgi:hypothetical protein
MKHEFTAVIEKVQADSPNGLPRCAERRSAANSESVSASFTFATQFGKRGIGQAESNAGAGSTGCRQRHSEPQRHASARGTSLARKAFRSTYRQTVRKWLSSWTGKLLNRPW